MSDLQSHDEDHLRAVTSGIAKAYDVMPYDVPPHLATDPDRVLGVAALYGACPPFGDVLDIGCGSGARLERLATQLDGKLHGLDIAPAGLEQARVRLAPWRDRVTLFEGDLLDASPGELGQYDMIYCTGVLFVVPPEVRRRALKLIAACLKPNGVAVLSYYAGAGAAVRAHLYRLLRTGVDPAATPEARVAIARQRLAQVAEFSQGAPGQAPVMDAVNFANQLGDLNLFHEALNETSEALATGDLEAELSMQGMHFLGYAEHGLVAASSRERAWAADFLDLVQSPYRYAIFAKVPDGRPRLRAPEVRWTSILARVGEGGYAEEKVAFGADDGRSVNIPGAFTQAVLDELAASGPLTWAELVTLGKARLKAAGGEEPGEGAEDLLEQHFMGLWRVGFVQPSRVKG
jgi:SAM-dependent methyltransferase